MKIAMFGHKRVPSREGGVEIVVEELGARMAALGHKVTCYNRGGHHVGGADFDGEKKTEYRSMTLKTVPTLDKKGLAAVTSSFFAGFAAAFGSCDVVHIHAEGAAAMAWLPRLMGKKVVVTVHGLDWQREKWSKGFGSKYIRWGEKTAVKCAHEIIVLSRNVQDYFRQTYGRETVFIPNGVDRPQRRSAAQITADYGLEKDGYLLFLGRLVPEKGVHYLIEAFKTLKTDKKLVIAGSGSDTDQYVQQLRQLAEGDDRILFTGFVQGALLEELYSNAYLYVLPSDLEGMPLSLLEAMSYGNCCVTSDIAECATVMEDRGVTFPKGDVAALGETLQQLCDDPERVVQYQKTAADFICEKYNWDDVAAQTLQLYR